MENKSISGNIHRSTGDLISELGSHIDISAFLKENESEFAEEDLLPETG